MSYGVADIRASQVKNLPPPFRNSAIGMRFRERPLGRAFASQRDNQEIQAFVLISAKMKDGRWLNLASAQRDRNPQLIRNLIFQTVLLYLLLLIPLIVLGRFISKPLKALTQNARDFDPSKTANDVAAGGPPDVQHLIEAFNMMQSRVGAMLNEKDVMLGAIGHDLRTPLAALRVRVESVENVDDREKMIAGIEDIDQTLDDILSLARLGRSGSEAELTDVSALIETVVDEFVDMGKQVSFERRGRINAPLRTTLIRRALRNLISNAVKYGKSADIAVDKTEDKLVITVDDIGPGIPDDQMENMFEPFVRADASRNRASGGSGLGLTLARAIARGQGGDITLKNLEDGGLRASLIISIA
ncbi:sensor histidine kinase [Parasphingorhabdus halotolerans]|uniref:histidine kinase n=1 Tax=Parasphingorhabdus halotolerans TaxID=2725558 RepID=A0A6H2DJT6_9SPHN|nr:ATP-binding protein [Parasphingorhabdus halotolerans]QJB68458.1 two-component sensor histidine kinase [Parasphingorhabdus halotolerans]